MRLESKEGGRVMMFWNIMKDFAVIFGGFGSGIAAIVSVLKEWPYVAKILKGRTEKDPSHSLPATDGSDEDHRSDQ